MGLLLAHFAIRQLMAQAAWARELDPDRLSFMHAVRVIKRKMPQAAAVSPERLPAARGPAGRDRARALREQSWAPEPARRQAQDEQLQCSASRRSAPFAASASAGASYLNSIWASDGLCLAFRYNVVLQQDAIPSSSQRRLHRLSSMRALYLLFAVACLCLLSFGTTVPAHAAGGLPGWRRACRDPAGAAEPTVERTAERAIDRTVERVAQGSMLELVLDGEDFPDFGEPEMAASDEPPPGYCDIWAADLLDPLDVLDEIEESGALFVLPQSARHRRPIFPVFCPPR